MEITSSSRVERAKDDDWTKVKDAAERKKIQNRLAQRLHSESCLLVTGYANLWAGKKYGRKKKPKTEQPSDESSVITSSSSTVGTISENVVPGGSSPPTAIPETSVLENLEPSPIEDILNSSPDSSTGESALTDRNVIRTLELSSAFQVPPHSSLLSDTNFLVLQPTHTMTAMLFNASLLNIACSDVRGRSIFIPSTLSTPHSLAPTQLQQTLPHYPYVDIIPIPAFRNKLLQAHDIIDPRDIWQDLVNGEIRVWGNQSWDERGWEITEPFAMKWWFLMDEEVLGTTNFWRSARGEIGLDVEELKRRIGRSVRVAAA